MKTRTFVLGIGALAAVGGLAWWFMRRKVTAPMPVQSYAPMLQAAVPVTGPRTTALVGASSALINALAAQGK